MAPFEGHHLELKDRPAQLIQDRLEFLHKSRLRSLAARADHQPCSVDVGDHFVEVVRHRLGSIIVPHRVAIGCQLS